MSHVISVDLPIKDLEILRQAALALGGTWHHRPHVWYLYGWQDDSPVPRHLFATEKEYQKVLQMSREDRVSFMNQLLGSSQYAIVMPGNRYEIGVHQVGDHYALSIDSWVDNDAKKSLERLAQEYSTQWTLYQFQQQGWVCSDTRTVEGKKILTMEKY